MRLVASGTETLALYEMIKSGRTRYNKPDRRSTVSRSTFDHTLKRQLPDPGASRVPPACFSFKIGMIKYTAASSFAFHLKKFPFQSAVPILNTKHTIHPKLCVRCLSIRVEGGT